MTKNTVEIAEGVKMPLLGFGTFQMGGSECAAAVQAAIEAGYRMVDTAEAYDNEEAVGEGIAASGVERSELFVVTKVKFRSYGHARAAVETSLAKAGRTRVDAQAGRGAYGLRAAWAGQQR